MNAKKKSNSVVTSSYDPEARTIHFAVIGAGDLWLPLNTLSQTVRDRAMVHGLVQRVADAAAIARDTKTGASATAAQKFDRMKSLVDHYAGGSDDWSPARTGNGGRKAADDSPIILEALAAVQKSTVEAIQASVARNAEKRGITVKQYLTNASTIPAVATEIARIKAQRVEIDADEYLAEMSDEEEESGEAAE